MKKKKMTNIKGRKEDSKRGHVIYEIEINRRDSGIFMCSCPNFPLWINTNPYCKLIVTGVLLSVLIQRTKGNTPTIYILLFIFAQSKILRFSNKKIIR